MLHSSRTLAFRVAAVLVSAAAIVAAPANARCFLQYGGSKILYEDPTSCRVMKNYGNCVDFKTAPTSSDYPTTIADIGGRSQPVIAGTLIPCAEVGVLVERERQTYCAIKLGDPAQRSAVGRPAPKL